MNWRIIEELWKEKRKQELIEIISELKKNWVKQKTIAEELWVSEQSLSKIKANNLYISDKFVKESIKILSKYV